MKTKTPTKTQERYEEKLMLLLGENSEDHIEDIGDEVLALFTQALEEQAQEKDKEHSRQALNAYHISQDLQKLLRDELIETKNELKAQKQKFEEVLRTISIDIDDLEFAEYNILDTRFSWIYRMRKYLEEALADSNHNANLNVQVAEHQIGATESAQVGSSKLKDKAPSSNVSNGVQTDGFVGVKNVGTVEDRGSNICECGEPEGYHLEGRIPLCVKEDLTSCPCQKFTPKKEGGKNEVRMR